MFKGRAVIFQTKIWIAGLVVTEAMAGKACPRPRSRMDTGFPSGIAPFHDLSIAGRIRFH
jgi:hypothetical protein